MSSLYRLAAGLFWQMVMWLPHIWAWMCPAAPHQLLFHFAMGPCKHGLPVHAGVGLDCGMGSAAAFARFVDVGFPSAALYC